MQALHPIHGRAAGSQQAKPGCGLDLRKTSLSRCWYFRQGGIAPRPGNGKGAHSACPDLRLKGCQCIGENLQAPRD